MNVWRLSIVFVGLLLTSGVEAAERPDDVAEKKPAPLTPAERRAIGNCLAIIRGCQLPDGAFNMVDDRSTPGSPVWIAPYFVNHAMLALLAANDARPNPADVARVEKWLDWSAAHQDEGGFWQDYTGTIAAYRGNGHVDAYDSSAALFLMVVERYQRSGRRVPDKVRTAAKRSLRCIQNLTDDDGLTWAKPDYKVKFLMDNIEVCAGLAAARDLFKAAGDEAEAKAAGDQAAVVAEKLKFYWEAAGRNRFAWALHPSGAYDGGLDKLYPQGLAQLFGIAFVNDDPAPFSDVVMAFKPQTSREGVGAERYLIAAARLGGAEERTWRANAVETAAGFTPQNVYLFRPALAVLALLEGADWMAK